MPETRWTRRSPATPVPYSLQQRQRENHFGDISGSHGRFVAPLCQVSQSKFAGARPGGGGYSHAPVGSLRPSQPSIRVSLPMAPAAIISFALAQMTELTRCEPICTMRHVFFCASPMATRPAPGCDVGFAQYMSL